MSSIFSTPELAIGIAVGGAAGAAFEPKLETPKQTAWANNPVRLPDLGLIAELLAGGKITPKDAHDMANRLGYSNGTMDSLTWLAQDRLNFALMLRMWRLAAINPDFDEAGLSKLLNETLAHERLDWNYQPYLRALKTAELIGLGDIAVGVVRSALPSPPWVPVPPPTTTTNVKRFPQVDLDPVKMAAALGFDEDMLKIMVARSGLSMAPVMAAQAYFRKILEDDDYRLAVAEGDLRSEWADAVREVSRQIPTVGEMMEHSLRGFENLASAKTNAKRHGVVDADAQLVYDNLGRAPAVHAVTTGLARGGKYPGSYSNVPSPYREAIQRSNIREEFSEVEYANRFSYPSAFVLRALAQAGEIGDEAAVEQVLADIGWPPDLRKKVAAAWTAGAAAKADPHVAKAQTTLYTEAHKAYVKNGLSRAQIGPAFTALAIPAPAQQEIFTLWDVEKQLAGEVPPA